MVGIESVDCRLEAQAVPEPGTAKSGEIRGARARAAQIEQLNLSKLEASRGPDRLSGPTDAPKASQLYLQMCQLMLSQYRPEQRAPTAM